MGLASGTDLRGSCFRYKVSLCDGRRGTFLSEEQICNCAVVPSYKANSIKVKLLLNQPEINIGANLQIFL